jgi:catechol 2,3-dioxygenase-like lactoylglutathione lyase family enzyme
MTSVAPAILGIDHLQLAMPSGGEGEARAFYGRVLGLREVPKPASLAKRGGVWFEAPGIKLHLGVDPNFVPAKKAHPAFIVDNLAAFRIRLEAAGCSMIDAPPLEGYHRFHMHDPFGNRIELMERADEAAR